MTGLNNITLTLGVILGYTCGNIANSFIYSPTNKCLFVFSFSLILIIIQLIWLIFIFPYETPKYLILN